MKMIQIRHVPDVIHRRLKVRAAEQGTSLSEFLLVELRRVAEAPTIEELWERVLSRGTVELRESADEAVRAERDTR